MHQGPFIAVFITYFATLFFALILFEADVGVIGVLAVIGVAALLLLGYTLASHMERDIERKSDEEDDLELEMAQRHEPPAEHELESGPSDDLPAPPADGPPRASERPHSPV